MDSISLKEKVQNTCRPDMAFGECAGCSKRGIPILLARYALIDKYSRYPNNLSQLYEDSLNRNMPRDMKSHPIIKKRTLERVSGKDGDKLTEKYTEEPLAHAARYILRRPRQGYLYLYDEINGGEWKCYAINRQGYLSVEKLENTVDLCDLKDFSCNKSPEHIALGAIITVPPSDNERSIYIAHVEAPWLSEWRSKIANDKNWREQHMQKIIVGKECLEGDFYRINFLPQLVFEYSQDAIYRHNETSNSLLSEIPRTGSYDSIAQFVIKTLSNHFYKEGMPKPVILGLHDHISMLLNLNELRIIPQVKLYEDTKRDENHRELMCMLSIKALENSFESVASRPDLAPDNFSYPDIGGGKTYSELRKKDISEGKIDPASLVVRQHAFGGIPDTLAKFSAQPLDRPEPNSPAVNIQNRWIEETEHYKELLKEFRSNKNFDYNKYENYKINIENKHDELTALMERMDYEYCWWIKNILPKTIELYDLSDLKHRAVVSSLVSDSLTGGIVAQSSKDLWESFHNDPINYPFIVKSILGWNNDLYEEIIKYFSQDKLDTKLEKKVVPLFDQLYIKQLGKLVKKGHSFLKDLDKLKEKDFSKEAFAGFYRIYQSSQKLADTIEGTYKSMLLSQTALSDIGLSKSETQETVNAIDKYGKTTENEFNLGKNSAVKAAVRLKKLVTFRTLRLMHANRIMSSDIIKRLEIIKNIESKNVSVIEAKEIISKKYAGLPVPKSYGVYISQETMPFSKFSKFIEKESEFKTINGGEGYSPDIGVKKLQEKSETTFSEKNKSQEMRRAYYNIASHSDTEVTITTIYEDGPTSMITGSDEKIASTLNSMESAQRQDLFLGRYREFIRKSFSYEKFNNAMSADITDRYVGRLSRLAIFWGFLESLKKVAQHPTDLKAWWKLSGSVIGVTQAFFDIWERAAKDKKITMGSIKNGLNNEADLLIAERNIKTINMEADFAKSWSKRIGVLGSIVSIVDGFMDLSLANSLIEHGALPVDYWTVRIRGCLSIGTGIIGILLLNSVLCGFGFVLIPLTFAIWLWPSAENLLPLGIRTWLRRSMYGNPSNLPYNTFRIWEEEQESFAMVVKGITVDIGVKSIWGQSDDLDYKDEYGVFKRHSAPYDYKLTVGISIPKGFNEELHVCLKAKHEFEDNFSSDDYIFKFKLKDSDYENVVKGKDVYEKAKSIDEFRSFKLSERLNKTEINSEIKFNFVVLKSYRINEGYSKNLQLEVLSNSKEGDQILSDNYDINVDVKN